MRLRTVLLLILTVSCGTKAKPGVPALGAAGGAVTSSSGAVKLDVPAGALHDSQQISVTPLSTAAPPGFTAQSPIYKFGPDGLVFDKPITVSIAFTATAKTPAIFWSNASGGYDQMPTTVANGVAQAQVAHFSSGFVGDAAASNDNPGGDNPGGDTPSSSKALTAFGILGVDGSADISDGAVSFTVPFGTSLTKLVATFSSTGASVEIGDAVQTSGATQNDFTNPLTYTVSAADASTADYLVTINVARQGDAPTAPTVTYPFANGGITNPALVQGTALPNASISVSITIDGQQPYTPPGTHLADDAGNFSVSIPYNGPGSGTATLAVTQTTAAGTSAATSVDVNLGGAVDFSLHADQPGGSDSSDYGSTMYFEAFATDSSPLPLSTHEVTGLPTGTLAAVQTNNYFLPIGTYYFVVFRDVNANGVYDVGEPYAASDEALTAGGSATLDMTVPVAR